MLESYFGPRPSEDEKKRLLAVQAALEIIKASASSASDSGGMYNDIRFASEKLEELADSIQTALEPDED
ncbi:hypothetical protein L7A00_001901 [Enterobacter cloacae]|nr:hypothetical protein [Enterobacter cloacae]EKX9062174.1 hypothetical protein [Enterobacter cloacae]